MKNSNLWIRTAIIIAVIIFGTYLVIGPRGGVSLSDFTYEGVKKNIANNVNLGLDLEGGLHLVMRVKTEKYLKELTRNNKDAAFRAAKDAGLPVTEGTTLAENDTYQVTLKLSDSAKAKEVIDAVTAKVDFNNWTLSNNGDSVVWDLSGQSQALLKDQATNQAKQIIESRIDAVGVKEPTLQRRGATDSGEILLQMPGVEDPQRVKDLIGAESSLALMKVVSAGNPNPVQTYPTQEAALQTIGGKETETRNVLEYEERDETASDNIPDLPKRWIVVEAPPIITGDELRDASAISTTGNEGDYQISFSLKPNGARKFGEWTGRNINNYMAVVLSTKEKADSNTAAKGDLESIKKAKSVAFIRSQIFDQGQIDGRFSKKSGEDLALTLKSGALPTELEYLEERTVGPSLGADAIRAGLTASGGGLIFIILFMLFYYRGAGINAVIGLATNLILTLAGLIVLDATLTLPGMAGLILGIGMAVDSNVLIFERMREEIRAGKKIAESIKLGFDRAWLTIIDSHVTTIIAGVILYFFGSGPIKGFAVTLILGLLINLFSAVFLSRTIFMWILERKPNIQKLSV